ncbi:molybdenum cofactor guanylyltransferase [Muricauda sp. 334s03]|uniref:Probable molybdenum cofactor guanylyltransferase n=1 Tax=Flagellimonas yonaguniensis TaxID=3031325 RepID=A0ABT5XYW5_9FLAO|nr:molybdenum cofactor guanylyltransferase [[Muricauda] yonaguniensis]MDF0716388.1 molybdenum cofactor guanylyltransferase [[Muricauda] yonaguniensis]
MLTPANIPGIVLSGGKSTRMGMDKAFLELDGKPFISHILETVQQCVEDVFVVSNNQKLDELGITRFPDLVPGLGPVGGIHTGLSHSKTEFNLVVACDTPFLTQDTIRYLIEGIDEEHDAFIVQCEGVQMPLIGIYRKSCLPFFSQAIDEKKLGLQKLLAKLKTKIIVLPKSHTKSIWNINTPSDFKAIENLEKET